MVNYRNKNEICELIFQIFNSPIWYGIANTKIFDNIVSSYKIKTIEDILNLSKEDVDDIIQRIFEKFKLTCLFQSLIGISLNTMSYYYKNILPLKKLYYE